MLNTISALFVVRNEEKRIGSAIASALTVCSEVVVVDQKSSDLTETIARLRGAHVYRDAPHGYCEASREMGAMHCHHPWILVLDADERPSPELITALSHGFLNAPFDGYRLSQRFVLDGKEQWVGGPHYRLFKNGYARFLDELHTEPQPIGRLGTTPEWPGIVHEKTTNEQKEDEARYSNLIEASSRDEQWKSARRALNTYTD